MGDQPLTPALSPQAGRGGRQRLALTLCALALAAGILTLVAWWLAPAAPPRPVRAPFGMGLREAAPQAQGIAGLILQMQGSFYRSLQAALSGLKESGGAWPLLALGFAYGVFHAAGPGHGKAVIAAYLVANERTLLKGFSLSLAAALLQALVAILLVGALALVFQATRGTMDRASAVIEAASFAAIAALGLVLAWRKAGQAQGILALARDPTLGPQASACDHVHLPPPDAIDRLARWRDAAGVVLAAGLRPCAGALFILVLALSQGLFAAGMAATLAMALGTALTTGAIAALAVFAKGLALRAAGGRGAGGTLAVAGLELLAAAFVAALGLALLLGLWSSGAGA